MRRVRNPSNERAANLIHNTIADIFIRIHYDKVLLSNEKRCTFAKKRHYSTIAKRSNFVKNRCIFAKIRCSLCQDKRYFCQEKVYPCQDTGYLCPNRGYLLPR